MSEFNFYKDRKVTEWERYYYSVEAESLEEATQMILNGNTEWYDWEKIDDTVEYMSPDENNGEPTVELYNDDTEELIATDLEYPDL